MKPNAGSQYYFPFLFVCMALLFGCSQHASLFPDHIITATGETSFEQLDESSLTGMYSKTIGWDDITLTAKGFASVSEHAVTDVEKKIATARSAHTNALENLARTLATITLSDSEQLGGLLLKQPQTLKEINKVLLSAEVVNVQRHPDGSVAEFLSLNLKPLRKLVKTKPSKYQRILQGRKMSSSEAMLAERLAETNAINSLYKDILAYKIENGWTVMELIVLKKLDKGKLIYLLSCSRTTNRKYFENKTIVEVEFNVRNINKILEE